MNLHPYNPDPQSGAGNCTCGWSECTQVHFHEFTQMYEPSRPFCERCVCGVLAVDHARFVQPVRRTLTSIPASEITYQDKCDTLTEDDRDALVAVLYLDYGWQEAVERLKVKFPRRR